MLSITRHFRCLIRIAADALVLLRHRNRMVISALTLVGIESVSAVLVGGLLSAFQFYFLVFFNHFEPVALEEVWNVNTKDESSISVCDRSVLGGIGIHIRILIEVSTRKPIKSHADQLLLQQSVEQELEGVVNAKLRHWNLPQVALCQIWVRLHHVTELLIVFFRLTFENLLQNGHNMLVEVRLAGQSVDDG